VVERNGQVNGIGGSATAGLFAIGPLCQGTLWEIMAVPEIVAQADQAAQIIAELQALQTPPLRKAALLA
jgi:uncharacterized NAD(P)/FAD-binding protein YdhS